MIGNEKLQLIKVALKGIDGRPVEPAYTNESPEAWAEIAEWERERADLLAAELRSLYYTFADVTEVLSHMVVGVNNPYRDSLDGAQELVEEYRTIFERDWERYND